MTPHKTQYPANHFLFHFSSFANTSAQLLPFAFIFPSFAVSDLIMQSLSFLLTIICCLAPLAWLRCFDQQITRCNKLLTHQPPSKPLKAPAGFHQRRRFFVSPPCSRRNACWYWIVLDLQISPTNIKPVTLSSTSLLRHSQTFTSAFFVPTIHDSMTSTPQRCISTDIKP